MNRQNHFKLVLGFIGLCSLLTIYTFTATAAADRWLKFGWDKTDFTRTTIDFAEILSGGPPKDGIPSIDKPKFHSLEQELSLSPKEPVIELELNGDARAYPIRILMWHEIVNDVVGGVPVIVTYCPLCNTSIVFERKIADKIYEFGTTGKLRHSDMIMYDRQTESWWQQFTGTAIVGTMLNRKLKALPSRLVSYEQFKSRHPGGRVLHVKGQGETARAYGKNPYINYDSAKKPFLYSGEMPKGVPPMARVVVFESKGVKKAISLSLLREKVKMKIDNIMLSWQPGQRSALDTADIPKGRDVGTVTVQSKNGNGLADIQYEVTFAFAFHAFYPKNPIQIK